MIDKIKIEVDGRLFDNIYEEISANIDNSLDGIVINGGEIEDMPDPNGLTAEIFDILYNNGIDICGRR